MYLRVSNLRTRPQTPTWKHSASKPAVRLLPVPDTQALLVAARMTLNIDLPATAAPHPFLHHSVYYPLFSDMTGSVSTLAEDILRLILLIIHHDDGPASRNIRISHVCRSWRNLALDTAALWTQITFEAGLFECRYEQQAEWLRRSKTAPLDISIRNLSFTGWEPDSETVLSMIQPHSYRWKSFRLSADVVETIKWFCDKLTMLHVPELEHFNAACELHTLARPSHALDWFQHGAPKLKEFVVSNSDLKVGRNSIESLSGLRIIDVSSVTFGSYPSEGIKIMLELIERSPDLECIRLWDHFSMRNQSIDTFPTSKIIHAHRLVDLDIQSASVLSTALLPHVQFPALTKLTGSIAPKVLPVIHEFNPFPHIKFLIIKMTTWDQPMAALPRLVSRLIALEDLTISRAEFHSAQYHDVDWIRQFSEYCPCLRRLDVAWDLGMSKESIGVMLEGRKACGRPLKSLRLTMSEQVNVSDDFTLELMNNVDDLIIDRGRM